MNRLRQSTATGSSYYGPPNSISHIHCIFSTSSHSLLLQVFLVLYIIQPPTPFTYYLVHHTSSLSSISRLKNHITSLFQVFPVLHITSPPFFNYFQPYTSHHLPSSAISHFTHHITSLFQLFPALHITSPHFLSYFPPYTSPTFFSCFPPYAAYHFLFQSLPILYTRQPPSPVISQLIRHSVNTLL